MTTNGYGVPVIHWKDMQAKTIRGGKNAIYPAPRQEMFLGFDKLQKFNEYADGTWQENYYDVHYDRDYLVYYVREKIITPLVAIGWKDLLALFTDAYSPYRSNGRTRAINASKNSTRVEVEYGGKE
jgi:hypothetical protein